MLGLFNVLINRGHHGVVVDMLEGRAATQRDVSQLQRGPPDPPELSKGSRTPPWHRTGGTGPLAEGQWCRRGLTRADQQVEHKSVVQPCSKEGEPRTRQHKEKCSWEAEQRGYSPSSRTHQATSGALCPGLAQ